VDILRRTRPDVVISIGAYQACAAFIRDARDAGWEVPIANVSFVGSENLLALLQATGRDRGRDYTTNLINSQVVPSYHNKDMPAVREYRRLMDRYNPAVPAHVAEEGYKPLRYSFVGLEGFLDAKLLVEILRRIKGDFRREKIRAAAESLDRIDLGIGVPASLGPRRHQASNQVYYTEVKDGRFVPIRDWKRWRR
jgi:hypothetical protein